MILNIIFLSACTTAEVETGIVQDNPITTTQYVGSVYGEEISEEDIVFEDKDYGEDIGIVPTYFINDDEDLGTIRLTNDESVEAIFFRNVSKEQVNTILDDIGIKENVSFERVLDNADDIYESGHKTKFQNMDLELTTNTELREKIPEYMRDSFDEIEKGKFFMRIHFHENPSNKE